MIMLASMQLCDHRGVFTIDNNVMRAISRWKDNSLKSGDDVIIGRHWYSERYPWLRQGIFLPDFV
jgi:hypothetical protein